MGSLRKALVFIGCLSLASSLLSASAIAEEQSYEIEWSLWTDGYPRVSWSQLPGLDDPKGPNPIFVDVFPVCSKKIMGDCIEDVQIKSDDGTWMSGEFISHVPIVEDLTTHANKVSYSLSDEVSEERALNSADLPVVGRSSIWRFPGVRHSGGEDFLVTFEIHSMLNDRKIAYTTAPTTVEITPISILRSPVTDAELLDRMRYAAFIDDPDQRTRCHYLPAEKSKVCFTRDEFTDFSPLRTIVSLDKFFNLFAWTSWFVARTQESKMEFVKKPSGLSRMIFEGRPMWMHSAIATLPWTVESYKLSRSIYNEAWREIEGREDHSFRVDPEDITCFRTRDMPNDWQKCPPQGNIFASYSAEDAFAHILWRHVESHAKVQPRSDISVWNFRKANPLGDDYKELQRCSLNDQPSGLISSNATSILPAAPRWNAKEKSLDFSLASTHTNTKEEVVQGFYRLSIAEGVAECLWQGVVAGAQAQVQIISSASGETIEINTSSVAVKNGFFDFDAAGFTYSAKDIRVSILVDPKKSEKAASESKTEIKVSVKTVLCKKGKQVKRIPKSNAKCPKGFKRT